MNNDALLDEILSLVPERLHDVSGTALYTGRQAWTGTSSIYLLGFNPGGNPGPDTIAGNLANLFHNHPADFSEYRDGNWSPGGRAHATGTAPMQRRVLHLFNRLGLDPGSVPASNVIHARSARARQISNIEANRYADECWPLHATMIERLGVKVIVCMGNDAANLVAPRVGADNHVDTFTETNARRWRSHTFTGPGPTVVQLTHPGIAAWTAPATDPTRLVVRALAEHIRSTI